jgi:DNA processing protein
LQTAELLALQSIKGVGNRSLIKIVDTMLEASLDSLDELAKSDLSRFSALKRISKPLAEFLSSEDCVLAVKDCESRLLKWKKEGLTVIGYGESTYPNRLTELIDPPALLFCRGNTELLNNAKSIAVVGTRQNTRLGDVIANRTIEFFGKEGFVIVSGLALGIDGIAHRAAIEYNASTIAVLVDIQKIMPSSHVSLAQEILNRGGLLISENHPETPVVPALFAKRDRIQAGLSVAVFAIETSTNGGTMHAVRSSIDLKRKVFVPNAQAAGYKDLDADEISGTQSLVHDGLAEAYTKESYSAIASFLDIEATRLQNE